MTKRNEEKMEEDQSLPTVWQSKASLPLLLLSINLSSPTLSGLPCWPQRTCWEARLVSWRWQAEVLRNPTSCISPTPDELLSWSNRKRSHCPPPPHPTLVAHKRMNLVLSVIDVIICSDIANSSNDVVRIKNKYNKMFQLCNR